VSAMTPRLADGLAAGFNNRLYLRVTTADGRPLPDAAIAVKRAWDPKDEGVSARLDADSVTRVQIDPGAPVSVIIPARPYRQPPRAAFKVRRTRAHDLISDEQASLDDQVAMDRWLKLLSPCAKWVGDESDAQVALAISSAGAVTASAAYDQLSRQRLKAGNARLYGLTFSFDEPQLPKLETTIDQAVGEHPEGLEELIAAAARDARDCLPRRYDGELPWILSWRLAAKSKTLSTQWVPAPNVKRRGFPASAQSCITRAIARRSLAKAATLPALGVVRYTLEQPATERRYKPRPTIMRGYELLVSASAGDQKVGQTKLRLRPGRIPPFTLRATPSVATVGGKIELKMLRGPGFRGGLPRVISVTHLGNTKAIKLPKDAKGTSYTLPKDKHGWFSFAAHGSRALVFVPQDKRLSVAVKSEKPRYAPGTKAKLLISTRAGQSPTQAAVGLFGVDASLEQLVPLPGADALQPLLPKVKMRSKAFGLLEGQALVQGRIRGKFAAEATVLRVSSVPTPAQLDVIVSGEARTRVPAVETLTDRFYIVLDELYRMTRKWEREAPKGEQMRPATMAKLWNKALESCEAKGKKVRDAFGRRLMLHRLPSDLLALTDPRQVVTVGTRLPEDVEDWRRWVLKRRPR
jgi:hypothetical protein